MSSADPAWRRTFVKESSGLRSVTRSAIIDGVRLYQRRTWKLPADADQDLIFLPQEARYWTTDHLYTHNSWQAALAATMQPVEPNLP